MSVTVRTAVRADARHIATVKVETWRAAYAGLVAPAVLDNLDIDRDAAERERRWDEIHADPRVTEFIAEVDGALAGWAAVGPCLDDDAGDSSTIGQVYAIYALPAHWGAGVGHALLTEAEAWLRAAGFTHGRLWYLAGNERASWFYERHGWHEDGARTLDSATVGGVAEHALDERRRAKQL